MKKSTFLIPFLVCACYSLCFAQLGSNKKQRQLFILGKTFIYISNDFIQPGNNPKEYSPFFHKELKRYYSITGPTVTINALQLDSLDTWHGSFSFSDDAVAYTARSTAIKFRLNNLQARVLKNGVNMSNWKDVATYTPYKETVIYEGGKAGNFKTSYQLLNTELAVNDSVVVEIRQKINNAKLLTIYLKRIAIPFQPFLAEIVHDSSFTTTADQFIQHQAGEWIYRATEVNSFYNNWPVEGITLNNAKYFPSSKLAFYFRRHDNYPDSSLEYKLTGGQYDDTSWRLTGHLILVARLQSNSNYTMLVRYKDNPEKVVKYTFYVPSRWYQKYLYLLVYIPGFLLLFFTTVLIARYRVKKANDRKAKLALELKSIRSQLNPHFVFNALSSIQALINKNEVELANQYLTDFSSLLRDSLKSHGHDLVPAAIDIKTLENYIKLEQLRFRFQYEINIADFLNLSGIDIPSLLLQPLIENAIKHGIALLKENGRLLIEFSKQGDNTLMIKIEDNGKGFDATAIADDKYGLKLTRERIHLLNKSFKGQSINMQIASSDKGTTVTLTFNHWL